MLIPDARRAESLVVLGVFALMQASLANWLEADAAFAKGGPGGGSGMGVTNLVDFAQLALTAGTTIALAMPPKAPYPDKKDAAKNGVTNEERAPRHRRAQVPDEERLRDAERLRFQGSSAFPRPC